MKRNSYPFRMPQDLREVAEKLAKKEERSLNGQLLLLVRAGLIYLTAQKENAPVASNN